MSKNKGIRNLMIKIFGNKCMIEELGIRKIPIQKRKKIKGYRKVEDEITYHHIKQKQNGGQPTIENGALLKGYNHAWLHTLSDKEKEEINQQLQQYKIRFLVMTGNIEILKSLSLDGINLEEFDDCIEIPVGTCTKEQFEQMKRRKQNNSGRSSKRATVQYRKRRQELREEYEDIYEEEI